MREDLIVYRAWPTAVITEAVRELNDQMHNGAGIPEIQAGLHGLDFLTRRSIINDCLQSRVDGCITEARMRIELLSAHEAAARTSEENLKLAIVAVTGLKRLAESILERSRIGFNYADSFYFDPFTDDDCDDEAAP